MTRPGPSIFQRMGRGPARLIDFSEDGPRPDPAYDIFNFSRPGPSRPIKLSNVSARPSRVFFRFDMETNFFS